MESYRLSFYQVEVDGVFPSPSLLVNHTLVTILQQSQSPSLYVLLFVTFPEDFFVLQGSVILISILKYNPGHGLGYRAGESRLEMHSVQVDAFIICFDIVTSLSFQYYSATLIYFGL